MANTIFPSGKNSRSQAINDLIESIALEEVALSNVINAEGDKLQKVIKCNNIDPETLICVNKSVQSTINAITRLEVMLHAKLDIVSCDLCKPPCQ